MVGVALLNSTLPSLNIPFQPLLRLWAKSGLLKSMSPFGSQELLSMKSSPKTFLALRSLFF